MTPLRKSTNSTKISPRNMQPRQKAISVKGAEKSCIVFGNPLDRLEKHNEEIRRKEAYELKHHN